MRSASAERAIPEHDPEAVLNIAGVVRAGRLQSPGRARSCTPSSAGAIPGFAVLVEFTRRQLIAKNDAAEAARHGRRSEASSAADAVGDVNSVPLRTSARKFGLPCSACGASPHLGG